MKLKNVCVSMYVCMFLLGNINSLFSECPKKVVVAKGSNHSNIEGRCYITASNDIAETVVIAKHNPKIIIREKACKEWFANITEKGKSSAFAMWNTVTACMTPPDTKDAQGRIIKGQLIGNYLIQLNFKIGDVVKTLESKYLVK